METEMSCRHCRTAHKRSFNVTSRSCGSIGRNYGKYLKCQPSAVLSKRWCYLERIWNKYFDRQWKSMQVRFIIFSYIRRYDTLGYPTRQHKVWRKNMFKYKLTMIRIYAVMFSDQLIQMSFFSWFCTYKLFRQSICSEFISPVGNSFYF